MMIYKKRLYLLALIISSLLLPAFSQSNTDYAKIPFETKDGYILLPFDFTKNFRLNLVLDTGVTFNTLNQQGISKFDVAVNKSVGKGLYAWLRDQISKDEPELTSLQLDERIKEKQEGKISIMKSKMKCGNLWFYNEDFFDDHDSKFPGDGVISLKSFKNVRNIVIDYRSNALEVNAPPHEKVGIPIHKIDDSSLYAYYIFAEIDGKKQPCILATISPFIIIQEKNSVSDTKNYFADIKIGNTSQKYNVWKHSDPSLTDYNVLGLPFFQGKCVQLDFENMMLYVW